MTPDREYMIRQAIRYLTGPGEWNAPVYVDRFAQGSVATRGKPWTPPDDILAEAMRRIAAQRGEGQG